MDVSQITALIGAAASLLCTVVVGALTFFMKKTLASLEEADKRNAEDIKTLDKNLNDLKALDIKHILCNHFFKNCSHIF